VLTFAAHVKSTAPVCTSRHCMIHCQTLAVKKIANALELCQMRL
jgi:hypothetical protein